MITCVICAMAQAIDTVEEMRLKTTLDLQVRLIYARVALKLMPPILLCWPMTSKADVGDMAVEAEPSCQYSVKFCCCATDDSRGVV